MTALTLATLHGVKAPYIDYASLSLVIAMTGGGLLVLLLGLLRPPLVRERIVPGLAILTLAASIGLETWRFDHPTSIVSGALRIDDLSLELSMLFAVAGIAAILLSWRAIAPRESGHGEYTSLIVFSVLGMVVLVAAQNLVTLFLGLELLSIPLYVLCASETRRESSLESGLKYLIIGSVGSATLAYGLALIYGATGATDFGRIAAVTATSHLAGGALGDPMLFTGLALVVAGFAFKASIAPFHQWTPDVYEGAPTPVTAFMATATKAAALGVIIRFFDGAAHGAHTTWAPLLAAVAAITMIVGNVGALGQTSLKRMLGYSGVAQAGYMLCGVVVATRLGVQATVLYLIAYLAMNMAAFAVVVAAEHERPDGDDLVALAGLGARRPWLGWSMTLGMLALAGIPGTVGFIAKFRIIEALVSGNYTWLAIVLVIGSMISLGYYLRVVASIWMRPASPFPTRAGARVGATAGGGLGGPAGAGALGVRPMPPIAGGSQEADDGAAADGEEPEAGGAPMSGGRVEGSDGESGGPGGPGGEAPEADAEAGEPGAPRSSRGEGPAVIAPGSGLEPEVLLVGGLSSAAILFFGIFPSPLFDFAAHAGRSLLGLL